MWGLIPILTFIHTLLLELLTRDVHLKNTLYRVSRNVFLWAEQSGMTYCRMPHLALMPNCEN